MEQTREVTRNALMKCGEKRSDWSVIKSSIKDDLSRFLYEKTKRKPMILPIIVEI